MPEKKLLKEPPFKKLPGIEVCAPRSSGGDASGIALLAISVFLFLSLLSYDPRDPSLNVVTTRPSVSNLCGLIGSYIADGLVQILGIGSFLAPIALIIVSLRIFSPLRNRLTFWDYFSLFGLVIVVSGLLDRYGTVPLLKFPVDFPGGAIGAFFNGAITKFFGTAGGMLVSFTLLLLYILQLTKRSVRRFMQALISAGQLPAWLMNIGWAGLKQYALSLKSRIQLWNSSRLENGFQNVKTGSEVRAFSHPSNFTQYIEEPEVAKHAPIDGPEIGGLSWERLSCLPVDDLPQASIPEYNAPESSATKSRVTKQAELAQQNKPAKVFRWKSIEIDNDLSEADDDSGVEDDLRPTPAMAVTESVSQKAATIEADDLTEHETVPIRPIKVTKRADEKPLNQNVGQIKLDDTDYQLPGLDLLDNPPESMRMVDEKILEINARVLEQKLADLGIKGEVVEIHPGPVITMYELNLASGIPLRRVLNTSDDLAMALKSGSTRVVAPIPGKDTVGIEVPNLNREIVYFKEIIESSAFISSNSPLKMALGKEIDGEPFVSSLARMPHLLIAGATGTGKSVGLNCLICSWLMSCSPDDVKFLMVDPKKLELSYYQDIPHLIHPVVTEAEKVPKVLSWAIREMERRYDLLSKAGAKNIEGYNQKIKSENHLIEPDAELPNKLPYIIIIIDELAELMMVAAKDIEISIARLAQMARAAGIHLILATQRPSVDVITGVIKANFPARISYQVSAKPDSRTILDTVGAENLLGMGDMLFLPPGTSKMRRLHGAFVSENEIRKIADFAKSQRSPVYLSEITSHVLDADSGSSASDSIDDEKYDEAVALVTRLGHASISLIQRHMRIGYNRAARIIETMEGEGIIGPSDGTSRPREVLARSLDFIPDGRLGA
jgi:S-DNA-T family DNA segregation ATPase FtsK/SpoIIIE